ncbi:MAG: sulfite exporter TauE/SafE family protein [Sulfuriferula sp.]
MTILIILAGLTTGILLGLLGSGGSIVTVPALVYLLGVHPKSAIALSLGIVAITAAFSAINHFRSGNVNLKVAVIFGLCGMLGTYGGTKLGIIMPAVLQLGLFAFVMYAAAYRMLKPKRWFGIVPADAVHGTLEIMQDAEILPVRLGLVALLGLAVGVLTGLVGVGGGFLIIPALVLFSGIPMKQAVGTSLVVVAVNSATGFSGYYGVVPVDYALMGTFTAVAIAGGFIGAQFSRHVSPENLKRGFGVFLVLVATYILIKSVIL